MKIGFVSLLLAAMCISDAPFSPTTLNASSADYNNKPVVVSGFLVFTPYGHVVYTDKGDMKLAGDLTRVKNLDEFFRHCLTIYASDALGEKLRRLSMQNVVLRGRFFAEYRGAKQVDLGGCVLRSALVVDRVEKAR